MTRLLFADLRVNEHHGAPARFFDNGTERRGRLMFARNPIYSRITVEHWYLVMLGPRADLGEVALSLQWLDLSTEIVLEAPALDMAA